jgi:ribonuclease-3
LEKFQAERKPAPTYDVLKEQGPDHNKEFLVGVFFGEEKIGQGLGKTKKSAEQNAAKNALNIKG